MYDLWGHVGEEGDESNDFNGGESDIGNQKH